MRIVKSEAQKEIDRLLAVWAKRDPARACYEDPTQAEESLVEDFDYENDTGWPDPDEEDFY